MQKIKLAAAVTTLLVLGLAHAAAPQKVATAPTGPVPPVTATPLAAAAPTNSPAQPTAGQHPAVALTAEDLNTWLDGYLPYALHTADIAGAVVAVVKDGQILSERGYGYSDVAARTPVDPN